MCIRDRLYTVSWSPSDNARIDHYELCAVDADGKTVLTLPTTGNVGSLTLDLEQYQGVAMRFRVIARSKDGDSCFDGPDGALSQPETIVRRAAAPKVTASSFAPASPDQETFLNDLKLNMTLDAAAQGNVYFTGYIFSDEAKYTEIAKLAEAWQKMCIRDSLKGDFVGGLVGYGKEIVLNGCKTGKGYVLGSRFVGGLAGGFTDSGVQQNDTNSSDVFGNRYVGGIVSVNGSSSQISGMTNTGLVLSLIHI